MKVILDSNVYISALAVKSKNLQTLVDFCFLEDEVVLCSELIEEVKRILTQKMRVNDSVIQTFDLLVQGGLVYQLKEQVAFERDPKDPYLLALAKQSRVDYLITGDKDLLDLKRFEGTQIVKPGEFLRK